MGRIHERHQRQYIQWTGVIGDGDTVAVGGNTYTFETALTGAPPTKF